MKHKPLGEGRRKGQLSSCLLCFVIMVTVVSCGGNEAVIPSPSPTSTALSPQDLPTLSPPHIEGFTISDCLLDQQLLPHLCGIVPGQTTMSEVREYVGEPESVYEGAYCLVNEPFRQSVDTCWTYPYPQNLSLFFDDELLVGLSTVLQNYELSEELTLGEAVEALGSPARIILFYEEGGPLGWEQAGRADSAFFIWPNKGIYLYTGLYLTQGVALNEDEEVPPFPSELSINRLVAFESCTLEELESVFRENFPPVPGIRWIDWPGMTE